MGSALRALQDWMVDWAPVEGRGSRRRARAERRARTQVAARLRRLPAGSVVGIELAGAARIAVLGGELWVTGPGTGDAILDPGQTLSVQGRGRLVIEALRDARFVVSSWPAGAGDRRP